MGMIKRALRRTSRKLLNKIIPYPSHSHQLVLNGANELALHEHEQMGAKRKLASSLQRKLRKSGSKDTAVAEALLLAVKNHLPPIQFHHIHGLHAQLSANKCVARRTHSFCQALVFSNRVILPNERVYIKVLEIAKCWSGTIRFGFTAVDPATLACRMPKHACPDMTNAGHTWARALADEVVRRNSVIHFSYNKNGIIHYGINNQDCGIFHANVGTNQNLWFIVDIYGLTAAVELIDPRTNNAASNNESDFSQDGGSARARSLATTPATMYKSTSAMDELFGQSRYGSNSAGRRKKLSRKHARHAALIQANWPIADGYHQHHYPGVNFINSHYGQLQPQGAMQLPNLNSVTLPSAQQNIYSPMPNLPPPAADQQQRRPQTRAGRDESHDYHQIMSNTYSSNQSAAHQPGRTGASMAPKLTGSVSMANIAHLQTSGATLAATASSSSRHDVSAAGAAAATASPISQADLSHQFETMHLYERRMRKHQQQLAAAAAAISNQTPVAATRKRQHLQPISLNQTNLKRTPETDRDQLDKSASATSKAAHRIVSAKSAPSSSAGKTAAGTQTASLKPKTRHSIKTHKAATKPGDNSPDDSPPSKDCPICFERPINCVLYQCGHMCTCYECGVKQWKTQSRTCPICRTVIKDVIKTYMS